MKEKITWVDNNVGYFKDKNGTVWQIVRTPYKEIPIEFFNVKEPKEINLSE